MNLSTNNARATGVAESPARKTINLKDLVGSGDMIGLFTLPFVIVGVLLNLADPALFSVGGPPLFLGIVALIALVAGLTIWAWSVVLILANVPRGRLITGGPYALVKHPLYTAIAVLVLPSGGLLLNTWLGALLGVMMYLATRRFAPAEETALSKAFGARWTQYCRSIKIPWL